MPDSSISQQCQSQPRTTEIGPHKKVINILQHSFPVQCWVCLRKKVTVSTQLNLILGKTQNLQQEHLSTSGSHIAVDLNILSHIFLEYVQ